MKSDSKSSPSGLTNRQKLEELIRKSNEKRAAEASASSKTNATPQAERKRHIQVAYVPTRTYNPNPGVSTPTSTRGETTQRPTQATVEPGSVIHKTLSQMPPEERAAAERKLSLLIDAAFTTKEEREQRLSDAEQKLADAKAKYAALLQKEKEEAERRQQELLRRQREQQLRATRASSHAPYASSATPNTHTASDPYADSYTASSDYEYRDTSHFDALQDRATDFHEISSSVDGAYGVTTVDGRQVYYDPSEGVPFGSDGDFHETESGFSPFPG